MFTLNKKKGILLEELPALKIIKSSKPFLIIILLIISTHQLAMGQTATDGLMMGVGKTCNVLSYGHDQWKHYWEGTLKRENFNLGKVSTQNVMYMGALGLTKNLNVMVGLPFVWTKASAGTLQGRQGLQDLALDLKYRIIKKPMFSGTFSVFGVVGFSTPVSNYAPDYLPLAVGLHTTNGSIRGIVHYQLKQGFFATVHAGYIRRSNTWIDRPAYYTDMQHDTREVIVPDVFEFTPRIGYTSSKLIAEIYLNRFYCLSGNDIRRNDMPFPSNAMRSTKIGAMGLYRLGFLPGFGITAGASYTLAGRNVGQSSSLMAGITYVFSVWHPKEKSPVTNTPLN